MRVSYRRFLNSPYWRAVRKQVIAQHPFCARCGCHNHLHVHHLAYDHLGTKQEYYKHVNLEVLCAVCHAERHGLPSLERDWSGPEHISTILAWVVRQIPKRVA